MIIVIWFGRVPLRYVIAIAIMFIVLSNLTFSAVIPNRLLGINVYVFGLRWPYRLRPFADESARAPCLPRYVSPAFVRTMAWTKKNDPTVDDTWISLPRLLFTHVTGPRNFSCRPLDFTRSRGSSRGRPGWLGGGAVGRGGLSLSLGADIFPSVRPSSASAIRPAGEP